jgi:hypothetical protein
MVEKKDKMSADQMENHWVDPSEKKWVVTLANQMVEQ